MPPCVGASLSALFGRIGLGGDLESSVLNGAARVDGAEAWDEHTAINYQYGMLYQTYLHTVGFRILDNTNERGWIGC
jgi:hypothetical protein